MSIRQYPRRKLLGFLLAMPFVLLPASSHAEVKTITTEASYSMGEGESPSFAEAMVLQKAKQTALEQAGTYVESYTKTKNYDLSHEEIQTIAGGVLEVEVLEKTRTLVGDGLRFYLKIKATVTIDKMEELAQRIRGRNVGEEYKKLQEDYSRLVKELERLKQTIAKAPSGRDRELVLDQIRENEKAFVKAQSNEAALFQRLFSGQTLAKEAADRGQEIDRLISSILETGFVIEVGEPKAESVPDEPAAFALTVPIRVKPSHENLKQMLIRLAALLDLKDQPRRLHSVSVAIPDKKRIIDVTPPVEMPGRPLYLYLAEDSKLLKSVVKRFQEVTLGLEIQMATDKDTCPLALDHTPKALWVDFGAELSGPNGYHMLLPGSKLGSTMEPNFVAFRDQSLKAEVLLPREHLERAMKVTAKFRRLQDPKFTDRLHCLANSTL